MLPEPEEGKKIKALGKLRVLAYRKLCKLKSI